MINRTFSVGIKPLKWDKSVAPPLDYISAEISSPNLERIVLQSALRFSGEAKIRLPALFDLPAKTNGAFDQIGIDLHAPFFAQKPDYLAEVDLCLRGAVISSKTFRNFTQRQIFLIPTNSLYEYINELDIRVRVISGGAEIPEFKIAVYYANESRSLQRLEDNSIWIFSTARSGSTWLCQDILCWNGASRPMDEPGIGRMFAPMDWMAERFFDLANNATYHQSGFEYETGEKNRPANVFSPPFERSYIYARQENQLCSKQNWRLYLNSLRRIAFEHVVDEWGLLDYDRVIFKLPNESHAADVIMQAFPRSFMVFLVRDGRDVMKSRFSSFASETLSQTQDPTLRRHAISFYSHFWNFQMDIMRSAFAAHDESRRILLRYEELRERPLESIRTLFTKLGISISDAEMETLAARSTLENMPAETKGPSQPRQTGLIGRYVDYFSKEEIELMDSIMGANLTAYGYDVGTSEGDHAESHIDRHVA